MRSTERNMNLKLQSSFWINCCIQCHNHQMSSLLWFLRYFLSACMSVCLSVCLSLSLSLSKFLFLPLMFCLRCLLLISTLGTRKSSTPRSVIAVSRKCFDVSSCIALVTEFFVMYIFV